MASKLERFSQRARRVLSLAQQEAERMQHSTIDTEHLLIALVREGNGVASHSGPIGDWAPAVEDASDRLVEGFASRLEVVAEQSVPRIGNCGRARQHRRNAGEVPVDRLLDQGSRQLGRRQPTYDGAAGHHVPERFARQRQRLPVVHGRPVAEVEQHQFFV